MRKSKKQPEGIKNILGNVLGTIEKKGPGKKEKISNAWQKTAGEKAARHSRPTGLRRKVLAIEVDSSTWFYELSTKKRELLRELKKELKECKIDDIRFRMGDIV
ncbi:MAG: DUF721 domain-containing protein [Candidatus Omnitrophica bacterium]|nr:DUF721 domain-containing protein [Candidatus Omnitrophota bacterium]MBU4457289.1 DUF721 domain-containing protein [Candidatus Omnitrophota bacterium]